MTATAKKMLSVFLAFVLVIGLMPLPHTAQLAEAFEGDEDTGLVATDDKPAGTEAVTASSPEQGTTSTKDPSTEGGETPKEEPKEEGQEEQGENEASPELVESAAKIEIASTANTNPEPVGGSTSEDEFEGELQIAAAGDPITVGDVKYSYTQVTEGVYIKGIEAANGANVVIPATLEIPIGDGSTKEAKDVLGLKSETGNTTVSVGTLSKLTIPTSVKSIEQLGGTVTEIVFENGSTLDIPQHAFSSVSGLTKITLPSGSIGAKAFDGCTNLTTVNWASGTTLGASAFQGCTALTGITLPNNLTSIGADAFNGCTGLASITVPGYVTAIGERAFSGAPLTSGVTLGERVETIGADAFKNAQFTSIAFPASLREYYTSPTNDNTSSGSTAFSGCSQLTTISWPVSGNFSTVGGFWDCPNLTRETLQGLPVWITAIDKCAFETGNAALLDSFTIPSSITTIGAYAFAGRQFTKLTIPASVTNIGKGAFQYAGGPASATQTLTIAEGSNPLRIESSAFAGALKYEYGSGGADEVVLPARVTYLGESAFGTLQYTNCRIYNKDIELEKSGGSVSDPWGYSSGNGAYGTIYYPRDAANNSDIMKIKAVYEASQYSDRLQFEPFDVVPPTPTYSITGTVPKGASVTVSVAGVSYTPDLTTAGDTDTFTMPGVEEGALVYAIVSLDGYLDYVVYPEMETNGNPKSTVMPAHDWSFAVTAGTTGDMTPRSTTGTLFVQATGDYSAECRMAVFDDTGKLVAQGKVVRARFYTAESLPAGTYTVAAWQANDYFTQISGQADFLKMGLVQGTDYAWQTGVQVTANQETTINLAIPRLRTERIASMLQSGDVWVGNSITPPGVSFNARISYEMAGSNKADAITASIPAGLTVTQVYSATHAYSASEYSLSDGTLKVNLASADQASGRLWLRLTAAPSDDPYTISAHAVSGTASVPLGSTYVNAPAIQLVVPDAALTAPTFNVAVFTAPEATVSFAINGKAVTTTCTTNKVGRGTAALTIPADEVSPNARYTVTATVTIGDTTYNTYDLVKYPYFTSSVSPNVYEFYFTNSDGTVYLVREGQNLSGGYYLVLAQPTHNPTGFKPIWDFTAVLDSVMPLGETATLRLGMLDGSTQDYTMNRTATGVGAGGVPRYTYKIGVALGKKENNYILGSDEIPYVFEIIPAPEGTADEFVDAITPSLIENFGDLVAEKHDEMISDGKQIYANSPSDIFKDSQGRVPDFVQGKSYEDLDKEWAQWVASISDETLREKMATSMGVFGYAYKHEVWDPDSTWYNTLSDDGKTAYDNYEKKIDKVFELLAVAMGDKKPMPAYASYEEYLKDNYGYETGQNYDKETLRAEGYTIIENTDTDKAKQAWASYSYSWTGGSEGPLEAPSWVAVKLVGDPAPTSRLAAQSGLTTQDGSGNPGEGEPASEWQIVMKDAQGNGIAKTFSHSVNAAFDQSFSGVGTAATVADGALSAVTENWIDPEQHGFSRAEVNAFKDKAKFTGRACFVVGAGLSGWQAYSSYQSSKKTFDEYTERKAELERIDQQIEFYEKFRGPNGEMTKCEEALRQEKEYLEELVNALWWQDWLTKGDYYMNALSAAGSTASFALIETGVGAPLGAKVGVATGAASLAWSVASAGGNLVTAPKADYYTAIVENQRVIRTRQCLNEENERLKMFAERHYYHYTKNTLIDPSGWVYAGVEDNRLEGVIATIYQKVGDNWVEWAADQYDQVNPQTTESGGLFAWNVLDGVWKVFFKKDGYVSRWSDEMVVPPEQTKVAINMLRATAPAAKSYALADDYSYVDVTFDQYMKAAADFAPTVTVGGVAVTNATWVDAAEGTDETGSAAQLSLVLRVPLTGLVEPGIMTEVVVSGATSYTGTQMAAPYTASIVIPDGSTYFYVTPDETATFTKGSSAGLAFTFKRSAYDERTFPYFQGILVDGTAVDASNYTAAAGSVVVTLKAAYLETLADGDHTLTAQFADGSATADFKVVGADADAAAAATKSPQTRSAAPATGDRTAPMNALLLAAAIACCVMLVARNRTRSHAPAGKHTRR